MTEPRLTVNTITSDQLDALQDERDRLRAELDRQYRAHDSRDALQYALSGLTPESRAIARVRKLLSHPGQTFDFNGFPVISVRLVLAALDEPKEPTKPHGHLPGERTAKDCRACASELFDEYWRNQPKEPTT